MWAAVEQCGWALQYVSETLRNDRGVVLAAVGQTGAALEWTSIDLQNDLLGCAVVGSFVSLFGYDGMGLAPYKHKVCHKRAAIRGLVGLRHTPPVGLPADSLRTSGCDVAHTSDIAHTSRRSYPRSHKDFCAAMGFILHGESFFDLMIGRCFSENETSLTWDQRVRKDVVSCLHLAVLGRRLMFTSYVSFYF